MSGLAGSGEVRDDLDEFLSERMGDPKFALAYRAAERRAQVRVHAIQIAYGRVYPGLSWADSSPTGQLDAEAALRASDVIAALDELDWYVDV